MATGPYDQGWVSRHCRISQCFLQIIKCTDDKCCSSFQTKWLKFFPDWFLPAPVLIRQDPGDHTVPPPNQTKLPNHFPDLWEVLLSITCYPEANKILFPTTCSVQWLLMASCWTEDSHLRHISTMMREMGWGGGGLKTEDFSLDVTYGWTFCIFL